MMPARARLVGRERADVPSLEEEAGPSPAVSSRDGAQQRRLPGPVRPEHGDELALADRQARGLQRVDPAVMGRELARFEQRLRGRRRSRGRHGRLDRRSVLRLSLGDQLAVAHDADA